jgi:hypothetical protein
VGTLGETVHTQRLTDFLLGINFKAHLTSGSLYPIFLVCKINKTALSRLKYRR